MLRPLLLLLRPLLRPLLRLLLLLLLLLPRLLLVLRIDCTAGGHRDVPSQGRGCGDPGSMGGPLPLSGHHRLHPRRPPSRRGRLLPGFGGRQGPGHWRIGGGGPGICLDPPSDAWVLWQTKTK